MIETRTVRIAMWSGPRNISTAMMRAFESRADTEVMDEPFYGAYLAETGLEHPMRDEVLAAHATDWEAIATACATASDAPLIYQKHMCQHMIDAAPLGWMDHVEHAFLIRPPEEVATSFHKAWPEMRVEDLGFQRQAELFDRVCQSTGSVPPVLEARDVLENPRAMLQALCARLDLAFDPAMLSWRQGARARDGVWGRHWYAAVQASTGFGPPPPQATPAPMLTPVIDACRPYYETLHEHRLTVAPAT